MLAALILNVNTVVSKERLVETLWDDPPPSAVRNVQTYIAQLRKAAPLGARLLTKEMGYLFEADVEEVDLLRFEEAIRAARGHASKKAWHAADRRFSTALALWRGKPAEGAWLTGPLLGRPQEVIEDLRPLMAEQPLNEHAWRLLMQAYSQAGQRDKALASFRRARSVLIDELGGRGVGRSALAVHVAHQLRADVPDGQLYANLRGGDPQAADPEEVLGRFLRALGMDDTAVPTGLDQRAELYRGLLANGRYLVVLDDARGESQIQPLLPGTSGCAVLVTARHRLTALPAARLIDLPVMPPAESLELLRRLIDADRAAAAPEDAALLVRLCGGLPLAVRIAGARLAARPHWALSQLATQLSDTRERLGQLSHGPQAVRASLAMSYHRLTAPARRLFRLLGTLEAADFAPWVAAALLDLPSTEAEDLLEQLVDVRLLDVARHAPAGRARFHFHDLTRIYARECAQVDEPVHERHAALHRVMSAWLALVRQAHIRLCGGDYRRLRGRGPHWSPEAHVLDSYVRRDPLEWVDTERAAIVAAVRQSAALEAGEVGWELASTAMSLFEARSFHDEWRIAHEIALRSARTAGDARGQAATLIGLGRLDLAHDRLARARTAFERASELSEQAGDRHGHALALVNLAEIHRLRSRAEEALDCYEQAAGGLAHAEDRGTMVTVLRGVGRIHFSYGRLEQADAFITEAIRVADDIGDVRSCEFSRIVLREIELVRDRPAVAETCFRLAMRRLEALGFPRGTAYAAMRPASARLEQQDLDRVSLPAIVSQWDDMARVAGSPATNQVRAHDLIRMMTADGRLTGLGNAFAHYGRIFKSLHLLQILHMEEYRRMIGAQLNIGESRHFLARRVFFGNLGRLTRGYERGMEDQVGALGLDLNAITWRNSLYVDAAVKQLEAGAMGIEGGQISPEIRARLSPLVFEHINFHGSYPFHSPDLGGGPRDATTPDEEE
ncbi:Tn3 family transposase [Nonomuraea sp. FMUSA5-5]|uniref:Tn3 family transposase n=1 Tax=Nonomuraea composti TaxID=2720023 RepID=A0ABX1BTA8_9ACTN|nr:Tn3 family transposase [Nonomuraea sp. FMUSA5-5]